jgi:acyl-CoA reductase-like NAD-dependent aldehyde dehydrogenase
VVFTGSDKSGAAVGSAAAAHFAPAALELGGKSAQLVFADADLNAALDGVVEGITGSCGQMCIAGSRLYVEEKISADFKNIFGNFADCSCHFIVFCERANSVAFQLSKSL